LKDVFHERNALLIVDHLDTVKDSVAQVMELLAGTNIIVIATCRQSLKLTNTAELQITPFEYPEIKPRKKYKLSDFERAESVAFFIQQVHDAAPGYTLNDQDASMLGQICARLQGLPLAIELVAARMKLYPPQMILMQLDNRLRAGGNSKMVSLPEQALQNALGWSHNLLNRDEQLLFAGLSLFGGSWRVEAAEAIFRNLLSTPVVHVLESLIDKHLVRAQPGQKSRFTMDAAIRSFAQEKLKSQERLLQIREDFAAHYVDLAEYIESELQGIDRKLWLERLEAEYDNLQAVLGWSLQYRHFEPLVRITSALWSFWGMTARFMEGQYWLEQSLVQNTGISSQAQTKLRYAAGVLAFQQGDYAQARGLMEECLVVYRFAGDRHAEAQLLTLLGEIARIEGDQHRSTDMLAGGLSLWRKLNDSPKIFEALDQLTMLAVEQNDFNILRASLAETLEHFYQNEDLRNLTRSLLFPAALAARLWQCDRAVRLFAACSAMMDESGLILPPGESTRYDAALHDMRRFMGETAFENAWQDGFSFTPEKVVAYALEYNKPRE
jgi:non-specific serine/threonine protein kinase